MSEFKVGDRCATDKWNLEAGYLIRHIDEDGSTLLRLTKADGTGFTFYMSHVSKLLPYRQPIVVGSKVRWMKDGEHRVLALNEEFAWVRNINERGMPYTAYLKDLELIPEKTP